MKKIARIVLCLLLGGVLMGCDIIEDRSEKIRDLDFTVVAERDIPEELLQDIEVKKGNVFKITYTEGDSLYICVGYGKQSTGGYSVMVEELYLAKNAIYIDTELLAPAPGETVANAVSYPYVCIKLEYIDKTVVFD